MSYANVISKPDQARARAVVERLNLALLGRAAARRQGIGSGQGARSPLGLAQPRRRLGVIKEAAQAGDRPVTPLGYKTALRALPPVLAGLPATDPRLQAAEMLASAVERIGAVGGVDLLGGDTKGGLSDGGATTRIKHAARLRYIEGLANGWRVDPSHGSVTRGRPLVAFKVRRQYGQAQDIMAMRLLELVCIEGKDLGQILKAHGWSAHSKNTKRLGLVVLILLDHVARGLGL
jgi:hypothetical protein